MKTKRCGNPIGAVLVSSGAAKIHALIAKKSPNWLIGKHFSYPAFYSAGFSSRLIPAR